MPKTTAPASRRRATGQASSVGTKSASSGAPEVVRIPAVCHESLIVMGTPWSGPVPQPFARHLVGLGRFGEGPLDVGRHDGVDRARRGCSTRSSSTLEHLAARHLALADAAWPARWPMPQPALPPRASSSLGSTPAGRARCSFADLRRPARRGVARHGRERQGSCDGHERTRDHHRRLDRPRPRAVRRLHRGDHPAAGGDTCRRAGLRGVRVRARSGRCRAASPSTSVGPTPTPSPPTSSTRTTPGMRDTLYAHGLRTSETLRFRIDAVAHGLRRGPCAPSAPLARSAHEEPVALRRRAGGERRRAARGPRRRSSGRS